MAAPHHSMPTLDYESRVPRLLDHIQGSSDLSDRNKELLHEFYREKKLDDISAAAIHKDLSHLKKVAEYIDFDFTDAEADNMKDVVTWVKERGLAPRTVKAYKVALKSFYKHLHKAEYGENGYRERYGERGYPPAVAWMTTTVRKNKDEKLKKNLLTENDIQTLLNACNNARDKALISLLWETGARIGELVDLAVGDIEDHDHGKKVVVDGKTGQRRLLLISATPHLQTWISTHPHRDDPNAPLWVNIGTRNHGGKMSYRAMYKVLNKTADDANLGKPVNPHHFRHSRATYLALRFTEAQMCAWFGWVQGSDIPGQYVHLSGRDVDASYARIHGIEDEEEPETSQLAPKECGRCGRSNEPDAEWCDKCGQAFTLEAAQKMEKDEDAVARSYQRLLEEEPAAAARLLQEALEKMGES